MYSSIDLTEVELVEHESGPRENHSVLLDVIMTVFPRLNAYVIYLFLFQLRQDMINQKEGETEMNVKIHYDKMVKQSNSA